MVYTRVMQQQILNSLAAAGLANRAPSSGAQDVEEGERLMAIIKVSWVEKVETSSEQHGESHRGCKLSEVPEDACRDVAAITLSVSPAALCCIEVRGIGGPADLHLGWTEDGRLLSVPKVRMELTWLQ